MQIVEDFGIVGVGLSLEGGLLLSDTTEYDELATSENERVQYPLVGTGTVVLLQLYPRRDAFVAQNVRYIENEYRQRVLPFFRRLLSVTPALNSLLHTTKRFQLTLSIQGRPGSHWFVAKRRHAQGVVDVAGHVSRRQGRGTGRGTGRGRINAR